MTQDVDDVEARFRRNLLVTSAAAVAAAWLRLPAPSFLTTLSSQPFAPDITARVWTLAFAVIVYQLGRYHFSLERVTSARALLIERAGLRVAAMALYPRRALVDRENRRRYSENRRRGELYERSVSMKDVRLLSGRRGEGRRLYGQIRWSFEGDEDFYMKYPEIPGQDPVCDKWELTRWQSVKAAVRSRMQVIWTKGMFEVVVPYAIAAIALGVCAHNGIIALVEGSFKAAAGVGQ